jgi:hypothetical protein
LYTFCESQDVGWPVQDASIGLRHGQTKAGPVQPYQADVQPSRYFIDWIGFEAGGWLAVKVEKWFPVMVTILSVA